MAVDLKTNAEIIQLREFLESRNLYTPQNPYHIDSPTAVKAINAISKIINPTKGFDLTNTVFGRLIGPNTPIAQIGIEQLGKQFAQNITQRALTATLPSINFNNLFDGNPNTKLLTTRVDYKITLDTSKSNFQNFLNKVTGTQPIIAPYVLSSPIGYNIQDKNNSDNTTLIKFTSKGVQNFLFDALNRNLFKKSDIPFIKVAENQKFEIVPAGKEWFDRIVFPLNDPDNFPEPILPMVDYINMMTTDLQNASLDDKAYEYGSESYLKRVGITQLDQQEKAGNKSGQPSTDDLDIRDEAYGFINDTTTDNQIIWGRDGAQTLGDKFGARAGLLAYTRALMQARGFQNSSINQTNTKWYAVSRDKNGNKVFIPSYNGSPLTRDLDDKTRTERQSNILDPYNNYKKAIRFEGNRMYSAINNSSHDSTIYETVIPKMHPIFDKEKNTVDNKNLMFSIENLAYSLTEDGQMLNSKFKLPKTEVGQLGGRLMWFPPYGIEFSESAMAKHESTYFIGRSEPIYTYNSAERIGRLSFKLIIDYPPQVRGQRHGDIAKFFAFGGNFKGDDFSNVDIPALESENKNLEDQMNRITPNVQTFVTPPDAGDAIPFYFSNDNSSIDSDIQAGYETGNGIDIIDGGNDNGLNKDYSTKVDQFIKDKLTLADPEDYKLLQLTFVGSATKLYDVKSKQFVYNLDLSGRRVNALYNYLQGKFTATHNGNTMEQLGIKIIKKPLGSTNGTDLGALRQNMNLPNVKPERNAKVQFTYAGSTKYKAVKLTPDEQNARDQLQQKIDANKKKIGLAQQAQNGNLFRLLSVEDKSFTGYEPMEKRTLSPVFHSQTPEDFHRRLTFLQQCVRQGTSPIDSKSSGSPTTNSVFGKPPVCVLRLGDFIYSKVIIDSVDFDYTDSPWDMNPEGMGMQFMIANISISMRIIGGESLKAAIDVLQNAESFNYYANSTFYPVGVYSLARQVEDAQVKSNAASSQNSTSINDGINKPLVSDNGNITANTK